MNEKPYRITIHRGGDTLSGNLAVNGGATLILNPGTNSVIGGTAISLIAANRPNLSCATAGLVNGMLYCYVITATNATAESANSTQASARPVAATSSARLPVMRSS